MSDSSAPQHDGLWGRETGLPALSGQNSDRRPVTAATLTAQQRTQQRTQQRALQLAIQQQRTAAARRAHERDQGDEGSDECDPDGRDHAPVSVRVRWDHTFRYGADLALDPRPSDQELLTRMDELPDEKRRVLDVVEDGQLVGVIDLDDDGHIDGYEMTAGMVTDWGAVADGIDERIAESPTWPALNAALVTAAARDGYDVATNLPQVCAEAPLPTHDPAGELYYRLLNSGVVDVGTDSASDGDAPPTTPPARDESPNCGTNEPRVSAPSI